MVETPGLLALKGNIPPEPSTGSQEKSFVPKYLRWGLSGMVRGDQKHNRPGGKLGRSNGWGGEGRAKEEKYE